MGALLSLLFLSSFIAPPETWLEPIAPTSRSFVTLHVRAVSVNGCTPQKVAVTKSGKTIEARWTEKGFSGCLSAPFPWEEDVAIGLLDAGTYEVLLRIDERPPLARHTLIVGDAVPPFELRPNLTSIHGGETIQLASRETNCYYSTEVTIDGTPVPVTKRTPCEHVFVAPPHAAGAADVTVTRIDGTTKVSSGAALRYVDPAAPPDESAFERVLVPVLYNGPGAYGSQWVSEGRLAVQEGPALRWMHDVLNAECASGACEGKNVDLASFGNHPAGLLLFVPRDIGEVEASLFVRDTSRESSSWGAQVPVVREQDLESGGILQFPGVPFDPPYRGQLRLYGIDGVTVRLGVRAGDGQWHHATVIGACADLRTPCNTALPAFAAVDLQQAFPELVGQGRFDVTVTPPWRVRPFRYWGFVTVTNNETQHVSVMTP